MARVFLSHSTKDKQKALALLDWLRAEGHSETFLDSDKDTGIPGGADWEQMLYRELRRSQAVVILLTRNWMQSKWCFAEFTQARALGKAIFPVVETPAGELVVGRDLQAIDLTHERAGGLERLARALNEIALASPEGFVLPPGVHPFPGLDPLGEEQAAVFFGRDQDIFALIEKLRRARTQGGNRFIPIVGASGSGKSSLLLAGLLPRLKRDSRNWVLLEPFRPESAPTRRLVDRMITTTRGPVGEAADAHPPLDDWRRMLSSEAPGSALAEIAESIRTHTERPDASILIAIDQLETLFALAGDAERDTFLRLLAEALRPGLPYLAVATLRSEFLGRLQGAGSLRVDFEPYSLAPLSLDDLPDLVRGPARLAHVEVEDALVDALMEDAGSVDALPLIAFTLRRLYEAERETGRIGLRGYRALGDPRRRLSPLANAVRSAANEALPKATRTPAADAALKRAFIPDLVKIAVDGTYVRQTASVERLPKEALPDIDRLVAARLLVRNAEAHDGGTRVTVEVAHESLFRAWDRLAGWIAEERDFLIGKARIAQALADEEALPESDRVQGKGFIQGVLLERSRGWIAERPEVFAPGEVTFIEASIRKDDAQRARVARLRRWLMGSAATAALVFFVASAALGWLWREAERARTRALASLHVAQSRTALRDGDVDTAVSEAMAGLRVEQSPDTRSTAFSALTELSPFLAWAPELGLDSDTRLAWSGPFTLALLTSGEIRSLDVESGSSDPLVHEPGQSRQGGGLNHVRGRIIADHFATSGAGILVREDGSIDLVMQGRPQESLPGPEKPVGPFLAASARFRTDERVRVALLVGFEGMLLRDCPLRSGSGENRCDDHYIRMKGVTRLTLSPHAERVAVAHKSGMLRLLEAGGGFRVVGQADIGSDISSLDWSARGDRIAVGARDGNLMVLDTGSNDPKVLYRDGPTRAVPIARWSPDGEQLAFVCATWEICLGSPGIGDAGMIGSPIFSHMAGHQGAVTDLAWSPDGRWIASLALDDQRLRVWSLGQDRRVRYSLDTGTTRPLLHLAVDAERGRLAASDGEGGVWVWMADGSRLHQPPQDEIRAPVTDIAWDRRGSLVWVFEHRAVARWDPTAETEPALTSLVDPVYSRAAPLGDGRAAVPLGDGRIALVSHNRAPALYLERPAGSIEPRAIAVHPDGRRIYVCYTDGSIQTWDANVGGASRALVSAAVAGPGASGAGSLALSADGRLLAASRDDGTVVVYDSGDGTPVHRLSIHGTGTNGVAFSPTGVRLAALGSDGDIDVWDLNVSEKPVVFGVRGVPDRSASGRVSGQARRSAWIGWIDVSHLAVAAIGGEVLVYSLDTLDWLGRVQELYRGRTSKRDLPPKEESQ